MLTIVLPAYNEERTLPQLLEGIRRTLDTSQVKGRVIVLNDGSTDKTGAVARNFDIELIEWRSNRGLAEALRQGLSRAVNTSKQGDSIITMDATTAPWWTTCSPWAPTRWTAATATTC